MTIKEKMIEFATRLQPDDIARSYPLEYCIPVYHAVSNDNIPHLKPIINYKNEKEFEADLDILSRNFQFVNWDEFKDFIRGTFTPRKKIALLTFDDGLSEFHDVAVPILERKGIYAVNFINPKFIGNKELMYRCKAALLQHELSNSPKHAAVREKMTAEITSITFQNQHLLDGFAAQLDVDFSGYLKKQQPYMTLPQLQSLSEKGFGIANHGYDHPRYQDLSLTQQIQNTVLAQEYLKENDFISESFAFPFTDFGVKREFFEEIFASQNLFCSFGSAGIKSDDFDKNLQRIPMENGKHANRILKEEIAYFKLKKLINKNTIHRQ